MNTRLFTLLALLCAGVLVLPACPGADDDDSAANDDDSVSDDDDSVSNDDDSVSDDDDSVADDDDSSGDDDDSAGDDDDSAGDDDDSAGGTPIPLWGVYDDGFGGWHAVTDHGWLTWSSSGTSTYDITQSDLVAGWLVAQNGADNGFNPNLWSRFDFFEDAGQVSYCQTAYDAATEADALNTAPADSANTSTGCGGFSWSVLADSATAIAIAGIHVDSWGGDQTVTNDTWSSGSSLYAISQWDNAGGYAIAQNDAANAFNPNLWSRFDYTEYNGAWYYCQTAYDAADEATALAATPADDTDPSTGGCGGSFSWTNLTP